MTSTMIRLRMSERTRAISQRIREARPVVVQVEKTQVVIHVAPYKRGMGLSSYICRRWQGRF